jgi:hypothetical protein
MRAAHRLTSWWHSKAQTFFPTAREGEREGKLNSREVLASVGGNSRHVTVLGGLHLPPPPSRKPGPLTPRPP